MLIVYAFLHHANITNTVCIWIQCTLYFASFQVFCDWVERKLCSIALSHLGDDAEPSKTVEIVSRLTVDYLQEVDFSALQPGRLFAVFNLMMLLLGHRMHLDTCADLIQNKIFRKFMGTLTTVVPLCYLSLFVR